VTASFLAVVCASPAAAEEALTGFSSAAHEFDLDVHDAVVVSRTGSGAIELDQTRELAAGEGLVSGGTAGLVAGVLFGLPIGAALLGLAGGAFAGLRDTGIPNASMRELGEGLTPGQAALCVLVDAASAGRTRELLGRYGAVAEVELESGSGSEP
jgi:uncharacterized membrane protein